MTFRLFLSHAKLNTLLGISHKETSLVGGIQVGRKSICRQLAYDFIHQLIVKRPACIGDFNGGTGLEQEYHLHIDQEMYQQGSD